MTSNARLAAMALFVSTLFAPAAIAQQMTINPEDSLKEGENCEIRYSDPAKANQTVVVKVTSGGSEPVQIELFVNLDRNGEGSVNWTVADWRVASFSAPDVPAETLPIES